MILVAALSALLVSGKRVRDRPLYPNIKEFTADWDPARDRHANEFTPPGTPVGQRNMTLRLAEQEREAHRSRRHVHNQTKVEEDNRLKPHQLARIRKQMLEAMAEKVEIFEPHSTTHISVLRQLAKHYGNIEETELAGNRTRRSGGVSENFYPEGGLTQEDVKAILSERFGPVGEDPDRYDPAKMLLQKTYLEKKCEAKVEPGDNKCKDVIAPLPAKLDRTSYYALKQKCNAAFGGTECEFKSIRGTPFNCYATDSAKKELCNFVEGTIRDQVCNFTFPLDKSKSNPLAFCDQSQEFNELLEEIGDTKKYVKVHRCISKPRECAVQSSATYGQEALFNAVANNTNTVTLEILKDSTLSRLTTDQKPPYPMMRFWANSCPPIPGNQPRSNKASYPYRWKAGAKPALKCREVRRYTNTGFNFEYPEADKIFRIISTEPDTYDSYSTSYGRQMCQTMKEFGAKYTGTPFPYDRTSDPTPAKRHAQSQEEHMCDSVINHDTPQAYSPWKYAPTGEYRYGPSVSRDFTGKFTAVYYQAKVLYLLGEKACDGISEELKNTVWEFDAKVDIDPLVGLFYPDEEYWWILEFPSNNYGRRRVFEHTTKIGICSRYESDPNYAYAGGKRCIEMMPPETTGITLRNGVAASPFVPRRMSSDGTSGMYVFYGLGSAGCKQVPFKEKSAYPPLYKYTRNLPRVCDGNGDGSSFICTSEEYLLSEARCRARPGTNSYDFKHISEGIFNCSDVVVVWAPTKSPTPAPTIASHCEVGDTITAYHPALKQEFPATLAKFVDSKTVLVTWDSHFSNSFEVVSGGCKTTDDGSCFVSPGYPNKYGDGDQCVVRSLYSGALDVMSFATEDVALDYLYVHDYNYNNQTGKKYGGRSIDAMGPRGVFIREKTNITFHAAPSPPHPFNDKCEVFDHDCLYAQSRSCIRGSADYSWTDSSCQQKQNGAFRICMKSQPPPFVVSFDEVRVGALKCGAFCRPGDAISASRFNGVIEDARVVSVNENNLTVSLRWGEDGAHDNLPMRSAIHKGLNQPCASEFEMPTMSPTTSPTISPTNSPSHSPTPFDSITPTINLRHGSTVELEPAFPPATFFNASFLGFCTDDRTALPIKMAVVKTSPLPAYETSPGAQELAVNLWIPGTYNVELTCKDWPYGNVAKKIISVIVKDHGRVGPTITTKGSEDGVVNLWTTKDGGEYNILEGVRCHDGPTEYHVSAEITKSNIIPRTREECLADLVACTLSGCILHDPSNEWPCSQSSYWAMYYGYPLDPECQPTCTPEGALSSVSLGKAPDGYDYIVEYSCQNEYYIKSSKKITVKVASRITGEQFEQTKAFFPSYSSFSDMSDEDAATARAMYAAKIEEQEKEKGLAELSDSLAAKCQAQEGGDSQECIKLRADVAQKSSDLELHTAKRKGQEAKRQLLTQASPKGMIKYTLDSAGLLSLESRCCEDVSGWVDNEWEGCWYYKNYNYCTSDGTTGSGWSSWWGSIEGAAVNGVHAYKACCACGGGTPIVDDSCDEKLFWDRIAPNVLLAYKNGEFYNAALEDDSSSADSPKGVLFAPGPTKSGLEYTPLKEIDAKTFGGPGYTLSMRVGGDSPRFYDVSFSTLSASDVSYSRTERVPGKPVALDFAEEIKNARPSAGAAPEAAAAFNSLVEEAVVEVLRANNVEEAMVDTGLFSIADETLSKMTKLSSQVEEQRYTPFLPKLANVSDAGKKMIKVITTSAPKDQLVVLSGADCVQPSLWAVSGVRFKMCSGDVVNVSSTGIEIGGKEYKAGDAIPPLSFELNGATFSQQLFVGSLGSVGFLNDPCLEPGLYESIAEGEAPSSKGCTWEKICMPLRPACTEEEGFEWCEFQGAPELFFDAPKSTPTNGGCQLKGSIHMEGGLCYTCA